MDGASIDRIKLNFWKVCKFSPLLEALHYFIIIQIMPTNSFMEFHDVFRNIDTEMDGMLS